MPINPSQFFRQNLVVTIHGVFSTLLFVGLAYFFIKIKPDPDYNDLLSVLIGALVTIVTIMFSAVLVALQLASAQFSPRITRSFFRENRPVQTAFYLFLMGIAYCLAVKFTFSTAKMAFHYPALPVIGAVFGFFLISFVLPRFVFFIADAINVASISNEIAKRTLREISLLYGTEKWAEGDPETAVLSKKPDGCLPIKMKDFGFLDEILTEKLSEIARKHPDHAFFTEVLVGNFISPGEAVAFVKTPNGQPITAKMEAEIRAVFKLSRFRNYHHDVLLGVRQLVDIGIKAISPAVNDPTTCVNCLHYLGLIVGHFAEGQPVSLSARAAPENLRLREFSFQILVNSAFDQIYQWGKHDPVVVTQLLNTLTDLSKNLKNPLCKGVIAKQFDDFKIEGQRFSTPEESARVEKACSRLQDILGK